MAPSGKVGVGFLYSGQATSLGRQKRAFRNELKKFGYEDGKNIDFKHLEADDDYQGNLPKHAKHLIETDKVAVLVAAGGPVSAFAAKQATAAQANPTPVVFTSVTDPVGSGLYVTDGNLTGVAGMTTEFDAARLRLLQELVPGITEIWVLVNPNRPDVVAQMKRLQQGKHPKVNLRQADAGVLGKPGTSKDISDAIGGLPSTAQALLVTADPFFNSRRPDVIGAVSAKKIPAIYQWREFVEEGGLMSFGPRLDEEYSAAARCLAIILDALTAKKPVTPGDIPLFQPTKTELVINLTTASDQNLKVPQTLLDRAEQIS
jgi:putative ABC transport system substrate-binding protein